MPKTSKILIILAAIIVLVGVAVYWLRNHKQESNLSSTENAQIMPGSDRDAHGCIGSAGYTWCGAKNTCIRTWEQYCTAAAPKQAVFTCSGSKSITAVFYPSDDEFVDLSLSDGRNLSVPHAESASGARYAKPDDSFVFWNKGDTAFITEGTTTTFSDCVAKS